MDSSEVQPKEIAKGLPHSAKSEIEQSLGTLPCHFNWRLCDDVTKLLDVFQQEEEAKEHIEDLPEDKNLYYLLLSYLFTIGNSHNPRKSIHYEKAEQYCLDVIKESTQNPESPFVHAELFVAKCNLLHIWYRLGKIQFLESKKLFDEIKDLQQSLNDMNYAQIDLIEAHALHNVSEEDTRERVLRKYEEVLQKCTKDFSRHWFANKARLGAASMLEKLRKSNDQEPSPREMEYIQICMETLPNSPFPFLLYAQSISHQLKQKQTKYNTTLEMENALRKALDNSRQFGGLGVISKGCAKCYRLLYKSWSRPRKTQKSDMFLASYEHMLKRAIHERPNDFGLAHELAIYFIRVDQTKAPTEDEINFVKLLLSERSSRNRYGNIWADIDLAEFLSKYNKENFDIVHYYSKCISIYPIDIERGEILYRLGKVFADHFDQPRTAAEYLLQALNRSPRDYTMSEIKTLLSSVAEKFAHKGTEVEDRYLVATCYLQLGQNDLAYESLRDILDNCVHCPRYNIVERNVREEIIKILLSKRNYIKAKFEIDKLDQSKQKEEFLSETYLGLGRVFLALDQESFQSQQKILSFHNQSMPQHVMFFYFSARHGSSEGARQFLKSLTTFAKELFRKWSPSNAFCIPRYVYEQISELDSMLDDELLFELFGVGQITKEIALEHLRLYRYQMVYHRNKEEKEKYKSSISQTLTEAAYILDRAFSSFIKAFYAEKLHGTDPPKRIYYPYPYMQDNQKEKRIKEVIKYSKSEEFKKCLDDEECNETIKHLFYIANEHSMQTENFSEANRQIKDNLKREMVACQETKIAEYLDVAERMKETIDFQKNLTDAKAVIKGRLANEMEIEKNIPAGCLEYIARHSEFCNSQDFGFIEDVLGKTNIHKHRKIITQDLDENGLAQLGELAHEAVDFSEKTALAIQCFINELPEAEINVIAPIKEKIANSDWEGIETDINSLPTNDDKAEAYYIGGTKLEAEFNKVFDKYLETYPDSYPSFIDWFYKSGSLGKHDAALKCIEGLSNMYRMLYDNWHFEKPFKIPNFVHNKLIEDLLKKYKKTPRMQLKQLTAKIRQLEKEIKKRWPKEK